MEVHRDGFPWNGLGFKQQAFDLVRYISRTIVLFHIVVAKCLALVSVCVLEGRISVDNEVLEVRINPEPAMGESCLASVGGEGKS